MSGETRPLSAQLAIGDSELSSHDIPFTLKKIDLAIDMAGVSRLLFAPSHNPALNNAVMNHCRRRGLDTYLWFRALCNNDILPERNERTTNAFGTSGAGESGLWGSIFATEEAYQFACPRNHVYNDLLLGKCRRQLDSFDGLFLDCLGYPLPSLGLEGIFSCFCTTCQAMEPRLAAWRDRILALRDALSSFSDDDADRVGSFVGLAGEYSLKDFFVYRTRCITMLAERYASLARSMDKGFGLDVVAPALAFFAGHNYAELGRMADWLKPRIYCHTYGPSSIPLEFRCMALGARQWAGRASNAAIMRFISRSTGLDMPSNLHKLTTDYLPQAAAAHEIAVALASPPCPIHPGIECSMHPDYETSLDESTVRGYFEAAADAPGLVLAWNLLFIPDGYLELAGKR